MRPHALLLLVAFCALLSWLPRPAHAIEVTDFVATNMLPDGEMETRIRYRGVTAKETAVLKGYRKGLKYRELTDGKHFIQLIYDGDEVLRDCEYQHDHHAVVKFLKTFRGELRALKETRNLTITSLDANDPHPDGLNPREHGWFHYDSLRDQCRRRHRELKLMLRMDQHNTTMAKNERLKRDLSDLLRVPETKWCGKGYSATKYTQLGGLSATDRCCRVHDTFCPFWIGGFETKYGLFNWRVNTLMHCGCDERFRACLKLVGTSDANVVGKIFFNIVQTKCFVIKKKPVCREQTWWGKCVKKRNVKQAILRPNPRYK